MAVHARGLICVAMTGERLDQLALPPMTARNNAPLGTAFTRERRGRHGRDDRDLGRGSRPHGRGAGRSERGPRGPHAAGAHVPAARARRRRARARRSDGGLGRPREAGGPTPGSRDLRDHVRGRHDGADAGPDRVRAAARAAHRHRRRPDRLPARGGHAHRAGRRRPPRNTARRLPRGGLPHDHRREGAHGLRDGRTSRRKSRCWCGCTTSA